MAVRPIVKWPDPRLRQQTVDIESFDDETRKLYSDLVDTMYANNGIGIAAIQIGDNRRMFLIEAEVAGGAPNDPPVAFINPTVEWLSDEKETTDEGCLSFPGIYVPVERAVKARIRAKDLAGNEFVAEGEHLYARAFQHENDHLTGQLLVDFVGPLKKQMIKRKMKRLVAGDDSESAAG
jgi:peptide deformylase